jgi:hypothetical protein
MFTNVMRSSSQPVYGGKAQRRNYVEMSQQIYESGLCHFSSFGFNHMNIIFLLMLLGWTCTKKSGYWPKFCT